MTRSLDHRLRECASNGNLDGIDGALGDGADVNARAEFGDTALNLAAQHGHVEIAQRLLDAGADIENKGGADMTPLMNAVVSAHTAVVRLMLENGARVSDDLLRSVQLKVDILEENAQSGMVRPEAVEAWRRFLEFLIEKQQHQQPAGPV